MVSSEWLIANVFLFIVYCFLSIAYCQLLIVNCLLSIEFAAQRYDVQESDTTMLSKDLRLVEKYFILPGTLLPLPILQCVEYRAGMLLQDSVHNALGHPRK